MSVRRFPVHLVLVMTSVVLGAIASGGCTGGESGNAQGNNRGASATTTPNPVAEHLFSIDEIHTIAVSFDESKYRSMIETYAKTQDKKWIEATVTIDGTTFQRAGMRLKGNSSLFALRSSGDQQGPQPPRPGNEVSADDPEQLPWFVKLDKFDKSQSFGGLTEFVVRSNSMKTALNEVLALDLLPKLGLASQRSTHVGFSVNDSKPELRLVIENPNDTWDAENFDAPGFLYKSDGSGNWTYRGDDPSAYKDVFDQETRTDQKNLEPLIDFLEFLNNSDDATFAGGLRDRLDVDAFVRYLAFQDLIGNFDDIDGPGNNSYLRYDEGTKRFTIVSWDHNLAFGGMQRMMRRGQAGSPPGGTIPPFGQNPLVNRFNANPEFKSLYETELARQKELFFKSGSAANVLTERARLLQSKGGALVDPAVVDEEVNEIRALLTS